MTVLVLYVGGRSVVRWCGRLVALWATVLALLLHSALGEVPFHFRDHRDQGEYGSTQPTYRVLNNDDAYRYLFKYGYLNCSSPQPEVARDAVDIDEMAMEANVHINPCSRAFLVALRQWQSKFKLQVTGVLDEETKAKMSQGRCGNSDSGKENENADTGSSTSTTSTAVIMPTTSSSPTRVKRRAIELLREDRSRRILDMMARERIERRKREAFLGKDKMDLYHVLEHHDTSIEETVKRRKRHVKETIARYSRETPSAPKRATPGEDWDTFKDRLRAMDERRVAAGAKPRVRRSATAAIATDVRFSDPTRPIKWRLLREAVSGKIPVNDQRALIDLSFRMWSEVIPPVFNEALEEDDVGDIDILVAFGKATHLTCPKPFDGAGGELAHSWTGGDIHFDEDENYRKDDSSGTGINLLKVSVHEIGHVLGLIHNDHNESIMYPYYKQPNMFHEFELGLPDRTAVQRIYGVCKGRFDIVFDWLRKVTDFTNIYTYKFIYNTYFFRDGKYWMYENRYNRTRYGDPLYIDVEWVGLPSRVNGYAQVLLRQGGEYDIKTYFFKGDEYYMYDDSNDVVHGNYPRKVADDFGNSTTCDNPLPENIDAVHFDNRDNMLYFYKDAWVWKFNPVHVGQPDACPLQRANFSDLYHMVAGDPNVLSGHVDAVYHSWSHLTTYFFKGENVYKNVALGYGPGMNILQSIGTWYHHWHDICDVA